MMLLTISAETVFKHCADDVKLYSVVDSMSDHSDLCCPHMWSRNKINSVLANIYFISAPSVRTCGAEIE